MAVHTPSDYIQIEEENETVYLRVLQKGGTFKDLEWMLTDHPRVQITKFQQAKEALEQEGGRAEIGVIKPAVIVKTDRSKMKATLVWNVTEQEWKENASKWGQEAIVALRKAGVVESPDLPAIYSSFYDKTAVVARGIEPRDGEDSVVSYVELASRKPTIKSNGEADFYDMNFVNEVKSGDWLGEKLSATIGTPGKNLYGDVILQTSGKEFPLLYDEETVELVQEENKHVLRAKCAGVVERVNGKIHVSNHLMIPGDVGPGTGHIEFDGSVTVQGTIQEGYKVIATKDVAVLGDIGLYNVPLVCAETGDIYIKGGIFANTTVEAGGNIYVRHANESSLKAKRDIRVGYYSIGSLLQSENVLLDDPKGKIVGGRVEALARVQAGIIGNKMERSTHISIAGFNREEREAELKDLLAKYKSLLTTIDQVKKEVSTLEGIKGRLTEQQLSQYQETYKYYERLLERGNELESKRQATMALLTTRGEGQLSIATEAFPETFVEIKQMAKKVDRMVKGTFYAEGKDLHYEGENE
ncbi:MULTISPECIES: FapA family protein [Pontibacillus]|uniref:FapA family protein n=1 Tax=Pontibacillus chungwhensis TaxID=265426 RepID=A0ABY8UTN6_9BACI|nr:MULTISPECIES: FapA family protein [Pontibacillus]MCD5323503.1 FapA family protein [Pontibacillus sp. HN14]WIF96877.1 FapA family protein [Pontibacillus chungwhensis]